ncbi:hypothetical protein ISN45_Aa07g025690 [Arabidopsis thaliana x Arabidopsis arenosa]|uniref:Uncharacterized protein n=1 Tax=Arabidopsis thaliana x Arabidopsis arenosa TaxID=1240361 RepID=A0A8T1Y649_9BRAS|nr:hypothetical protein ISN45_Aa07g025690 [Arabidopsis thaliana x Arabidopsis arenosa]
MNVDFFTSYNNDDKHYMTTKFFMSTRFFKDQLEKLLETTRPDCLIADLFFPLAIEATENFNVPRLMFHCTRNYSLCSKYCIRVHNPQNRVTSSWEPFVFPDLPRNIMIT